jgi:C-terminal processing protease CtpA/Prc
VGYLDIHVLHAAFISGETAVAAMNFLRGVHAMIIDLRQCRGGEPNMNALLSSYFFGEEPVQLSSLYLREDDSTHQYWTSPYVPSQRLDNIPLYVLTSQTTFSGGEAFAYDLKAYQRATLVGESTRGGAHPGMTYRLHEHFDVFIPNGRPTNPVTGSNWEGTGVTPDIAVPQEQAFAIAYRMALQSITKTLSEFSSAPYQTLLAEAQAALTALGNP